jgi:flagella basal body P-ring formation protein FlgA
MKAWYLAAALAALGAHAAAEGGEAAPNSAGPLTPAVQAQPRDLAYKLSPSAHSRNATLGDLLQGPLPSELAGLVVKPGLAPGHDVRVDSALVGFKLRQFGAGWRLQAGSPASVALRVPAQTVAGGDLRQFAQQFLLGQLSGTAGASAEPRGPVQDLTLFDAPIRLVVRLQEGQALRGDVVLRVDVMQAADGGQDVLAASVPVSFLVRRREGRLVAIRPIRRGDLLSAENLALREDDATYDPDGVPGLDAVAGKVAKTFVAEGHVLTMAMVDLPLAIQNGDIVRLMVHSGGVVVMASAKALRDARIGDSIPLLVVDSQRQVQGRCVDAGVAVTEAP